MIAIAINKPKGQKHPHIYGMRFADEEWSWLFDKPRIPQQSVGIVQQTAQPKTTQARMKVTLA